MAGKPKDDYQPQYHASMMPGGGFSHSQAQHHGSGTHGLHTDDNTSPVIRIRPSSGTVLTSPGKPTTLCCVVSGASPLSVQWSHDGEACKEPKFLALNQMDTSYWYLVVQHTDVSDAGEYKVAASNVHGETEVSVHLTVLKAVPPEEDKNHKAFPVQEFVAMVSKIRDQGDEFFSIELPWELSQHSGTLPCNEHKNRYINVFPYEHSRVVLSLQAGVPGSDYINACHMTDDYICSQGPLPNTFEDFWRMVCEFNIHTIAMVTKLSDETSRHMKCHRYWPKKESVKYGNYSIKLKGIKSFPYCEIRMLEVMEQADVESATTREICHFQFLAWPEYGVPDSAIDILNFREKVREYHSNVEGPLLIHCSAGVGRTGTFLCIDMLLKRMEEEGSVDIFNLVRKMRFRRERTVETPEQYLLIHKAIAEYLRSQKAVQVN